MGKYYHASPTRYKPGDLITGKSFGWSSDKPVVFMTSAPLPHYTIYEVAVEENWFIYQVIPQRKVKIGRIWDEAMCELVVVAKKVGRAREFAKHTKKEGSLVKWRTWWTH